MTRRRPPPRVQSGRRLRQRLQSLVVLLMSRKVATPEAFWKLQLDLLALQRDVQRAITAARREPKSQDRHDKLRNLRETLWHARRFGDTIAWLLFRSERRFLEPLSYNAKVPIPPDNHGTRAAVAAAQELAPRFGMPLIHDITDILRVGDITFFKPNEPPHTVEMKASVKDVKSEGDGTTRVTYEGLMIWPAGATPPEGVLERPTPSPRPRRTLRGKDLERQMKRLSRAVAMRDIVPGKATVVEGQPTLIIESKRSAGKDHWRLIRRLIRQARRTGYASGAADDAIMYVVIYNKDENADPTEVTSPAGPDLLSSGILIDGSPRNSLRILGLPDPSGDGPHRYLPYFLYPLPRSWIIDILRGRLVVIAVLNVGRLAESLEQAGFRTEAGRHGDFIRVLADVEVDGGKYLVELAPLNENITEAIMEALPLAVVTDAATTMLEVLRDQMPMMMEQSRSG